MRIAFVGKGGSGKTTLSALLTRRLAHSGAPVLAVDGDINQHLAQALDPGGDSPSTPPPLGPALAGIKAFLRGTNPRITSAESMIKTTPPGRGSRLLRLLIDDELHTRHVFRAGGVPLMVTASSTRATWVWPATTPSRARWSSTSATSSTVPASTSWST